jgi:protein-S-isoprenylcysteine O-methyltransferase Ste14
MNPWYAKAVVIAASLALIAIRAPHGHRSRRVKVEKSFSGRLEFYMLMLAWVGFFIPIIWICAPVFWFAEYRLHWTPFTAGVIVYIFSLWLFYRSHADLGRQWSITLEVREEHRLITQGVYRRIRHPMYTAIHLWGVGQALVIPNWLVGPSYFVMFLILYVFRVRAEERMMIERFGDEYAQYMQRTTRLVPGVF